MRALVTGGSGFLGKLLIGELLQRGWQCVNIDLQRSDLQHPGLTSIQGDIRQVDLLEGIFRQHAFDVVFHCAAILAHDCKDLKFLWESNVEGTRNIATAAQKYGVKKIVYTSTNCLWGESLGRPVRETDEPRPVELYGQSKWEGEKLLRQFQPALEVVTIRCPTIIDAGRLGLLAILFEFIAEDRRVWVVGNGANRYQFIYAQDLIDAMIRAAGYNGSNTFGIGSDDVTSLRDTYEYVIKQAGSRSKVASLPLRPTLLGMKLAHHLKISPLGPYHYKMIAENFSFETTLIKDQLGWRPSLSNSQMLLKAYLYFHEHRAGIAARKDVSSHNKAAAMGVIRLLKWVS